jgi:hypothetical protein
MSDDSGKYGIFTDSCASCTNNMVRNNIIYLHDTPIVFSDSGNSEDHNLTSNPLFVNASANDFHLTSGSPAKGAGATLPEVPCDFDGNARPAGSAYDIGAYEYGGTPGSGCATGPIGGGGPTPTPTPTPTPIPPPQITLQAVPTTLIFPGQSSYMLWSVTNATSCTASGAWTGPKPLTGTTVLTPSVTSTYTLTRTGPGGTASASITITVGATGYCHRYTSGTAIPPGFGVPWDVTNPRSMLLKAPCTGAGVTLELGDNAPLTYIYKSAYLAKSGSTGWAPITLFGSGLISNAWYPRPATAIVTMTDTELAQPSHYVGYVCRYAGGWKCGCRDTACTQSYWQIQRFKK